MGKSTRRKSNCGRVVPGGLVLLATVCAPARSQEPARPPAPAASVDELAERLRAVEALNKNLVEQMERSQRLHEEQMQRLVGRIEDLSSRLPGATAPGIQPAGTAEVVDLDAVEPTPASASRSGPTFDALAGDDLEPAGMAPEYIGPVPEYETQPIEPSPFRTRAPGPPTRARPSGLSTIVAPDRVPLESHFGPGFQFQTRDEEFLLQVHIQSQIESRVWGDPGNGAPFRDGFYLPRQRIFFNGRITRPIEYVFSLNRGFGDLNILETFLNGRRSRADAR